MNLTFKAYEKTQIRSGILHIGVGNFHRAHQQYYINRLLADTDQQHWGICGVCLLSSDERTVHTLRSQDLTYTLTICGRNGINEVQQINSLIELIWAPEQPELVFERIADANIKIITLTITEGGYNIDKATNDFMLDEVVIRNDLDNPHSPQTVFGFVAEGLRRRMKNGASGLTILSCDNLQHNGYTAKKSFLSFMRAQDPELAEWAAVNVSFPNSMVDRITPATRPEDVLRLNERSGIKDSAPVYCEDFCQWVIEDQFIAGRPALERVGVEFTADVSMYENMKLSLLNASHTLLCYPAFLIGYRKVDEAMRDERIYSLLRDFMDIDITPFVPAPPDTDLNLYKRILLERFANRSVSDQVARLCFDGISKFPVYIIPNLGKMITSGHSLKRVAFLVAAYRHYLKYKMDDNGQSFEIAEPGLTTADEKLLLSDDAIDFLQLSAFKGFDLAASESFTTLYIDFTSAIKSVGTAKTLASILE